MKYPYATHFQPAIPMLAIRLENEARGLQTEFLNALLDTGADGTLVPLDYLRQIRAPAVMDRRLRSHWGEWRAVQVFVVNIKLADRRLVNVLVVGDEQGDEIILGRDVLNKLRLLLDGPANQIELIA